MSPCSSVSVQAPMRSVVVMMTMLSRLPVRRVGEPSAELTYRLPRFRADVGVGRELHDATVVLVRAGIVATLVEHAREHEVRLEVARVDLQRGVERILGARELRVRG